MIRAGTALVLTSFVWAGGAMAQDNKEVADMARPADDAASCKEMNWNKDFAGTYPWVSEARHTVVVVNGEKWARKHNRCNWRKPIQIQAMKSARPGVKPNVSQISG